VTFTGLVDRIAQYFKNGVLTAFEAVENRK
jgi:hypothetical protein